MASRLNVLTQINIEKLENDFHSENYADSDSDCTNEINMQLKCPIDGSTNAVINDENSKRIFEWKVAEEQDSMTQDSID